MRFIAIDIRPDTTEGEVNSRLDGVELLFWFVLEITPQHKRIWAVVRDYQTPKMGGCTVQ